MDAVSNVTDEEGPRTRVSPTTNSILSLATNSKLPPESWPIYLVEQLGSPRDPEFQINKNLQK